jgi:hypothetical protein
MQTISLIYVGKLLDLRNNLIDECGAAELGRALIGKDKLTVLGIFSTRCVAEQVNE